MLAATEVPRVSPIFVIGSPRSGTSLIGAYLGSGESVANFGELSVFYFSHVVSRLKYAKVPTPLKERYFQSLERHAIDFALTQTQRAKAAYFVDSTPWNIHISDYLAECFPDAVFVLMLRHYSGVVQSLERSFEMGWKWAGPSHGDRVRMWCDCYQSVYKLPSNRTLPLSFDRLCQCPEETLGEFRQRLAKKLHFVDSLDLSVFVMATRQLAPNRALVGAMKPALLGLFPDIPSISCGGRNFPRKNCSELVRARGLVKGCYKRSIRRTIVYQPAGSTAVNSRLPTIFNFQVGRWSIG